MKPASLHIRAADVSEAPALSAVIRRSYADVAQRFNLTPANCPKHPSNCTNQWILNDFARGVVYYLLHLGDEPVGCAALEQANAEVCYLERLAVLSGHRRQGLGRRLVDHVIAQACARGAKRLGIGIIAEQDELKSWYHRAGFRETAVKRFDHLPFAVAFLEREITG